jgi:mannose-6-phosphate isomerase
MDLLAWHDVHPGDTFFIPAGTVHAIGEGVTLCEVQQESDTTYRLFDYGRPRELHLDQGVPVSHLGPYAARQTRNGPLLVSCDYFQVERLEVSEPEVWQAACLLVILSGKGSIANQTCEAGQSWHLSSPTPIMPSEPLQVLRIRS